MFNPNQQEQRNWILDNIERVHQEIYLNSREGRGKSRFHQERMNALQLFKNKLLAVMNKLSSDAGKTARTDLPFMLMIGGSSVWQYLNALFNNAIIFDKTDTDSYAKLHPAFCDAFRSQKAAFKKYLAAEFGLPEESLKGNENTDFLVAEYRGDDYSVVENFEFFCNFQVYIDEHGNIVYDPNNPQHIRDFARFIFDHEIICYRLNELLPMAKVHADKLFQEQLAYEQRIKNGTSSSPSHSAIPTVPTAEALAFRKLAFVFKSFYKPFQSGKHFSFETAQFFFDFFNRTNDLLTEQIIKHMCHYYRDTFPGRASALQHMNHVQTMANTIVKMHEQVVVDEKDRIILELTQKLATETRNNACEKEMLNQQLSVSQQIIFNLQSQAQAASAASRQYSSILEEKQLEANELKKMLIEKKTESELESARLKNEIKKLNEKVPDASSDEIVKLKYELSVLKEKSKEDHEKQMVRMRELYAENEELKIEKNKLQREKNDLMNKDKAAANDLNAKNQKLSDELKAANKKLEEAKKELKESEMKISALQEKQTTQAVKETPKHEEPIAVPELKQDEVSGSPANKKKKKKKKTNGAQASHEDHADEDDPDEFLSSYAYIATELLKYLARITCTVLPESVAADVKLAEEAGKGSFDCIPFDSVKSSVTFYTDILESFFSVSHDKIDQNAVSDDKFFEIAFSYVCSLKWDNHYYRDLDLNGYFSYYYLENSIINTFFESQYVTKYIEKSKITILKENSLLLSKALFNDAGKNLPVLEKTLIAVNRLLGCYIGSEDFIRSSCNAMAAATKTTEFTMTLPGLKEFAEVYRQIFMQQKYENYQIMAAQLYFFRAVSSSEENKNITLENISQFHKVIVKYINDSMPQSAYHVWQQEALKVLAKSNSKRAAAKDTENILSDLFEKLRQMFPGVRPLQLVQLHLDCVRKYKNESKQLIKYNHVFYTELCWLLSHAFINEVLDASDNIKFHYKKAKESAMNYVNDDLERNLKNSHQRFESVIENGLIVALLKMRKDNLFGFSEEILKNDEVIKSFVLVLLDEYMKSDIDASESVREVIHIMVRGVENNIKMKMNRSTDRPMLMAKSNEKQSVKNEPVILKMSRDDLGSIFDTWYEPAMHIENGKAPLKTLFCILKQKYFNNSTDEILLFHFVSIQYLKEYHHSHRVIKPESRLYTDLSPLLASKFLDSLASKPFDPKKGLVDPRIEIIDKKIEQAVNDLISLNVVGFSEEMIKENPRHCLHVIVSGYQNQLQLAKIGLAIKHLEPIGLILYRLMPAVSPKNVADNEIDQVIAAMDNFHERFNELGKFMAAGLEVNKPTLSPRFK